jgi:hypothetical protein
VGLRNNSYPKPRACRHRTKHPKVRGLCPKCYAKWLRKNNPEFYRRGLKKGSEYYRKNCKRLLLLSKKRKNAEPKWKRADRELQEKYDLGVRGYNRMERRQKKKCKVCRKRHTRTVRGKRTRMHVDHIHGTKIVRGLLCFHCNAGLGHFFDDPKLLRAAARYLEACARRIEKARRGL